MLYTLGWRKVTAVFCPSANTIAPAQCVADKLEHQNFASLSNLKLKSADVVNLTEPMIWLDEQTLQVSL